MTEPRLDTVGRTPEERERLARVNAQIAAMDLPEGVTAGPVGFLSTDDEVDLIAENDAAVFLTAKSFMLRRHGTNQPLPTIELDGPAWIPDAIRRNVLRCGVYGIGKEIEGVEVPLFAHLRLIVRGKPAPIYVTINDAPRWWIDRAMRRFALAFPKDEAGDWPYLVTGVLKQHPDGLVVPPKLGRNDACPCGSGRKAKRCCLA